MGIWVALVIDENLRGIANVLRWKSGTWKKKVAVPSADAAAGNFTAKKAEGFI